MIPAAGVPMINSRMLRYWGLCPGTNKQWYRIAFSGGQTEKRWGTFDRFYGKIYIGSHTGVEERLKYPWMKKRPRWFIEYWVPWAVVNPLSGERGSYEPVYCFEDKNFNELPVEWWAIEACVNTILGRKMKPPSEYMEEPEKEDAKAVRYFEDSLQIDNPLLAYGGGVGFGGIKRFTENEFQRRNNRLFDAIQASRGASHDGAA
jgi:hypothetical protein